MKQTPSKALTRASLLACASLCAVTNSVFAASQNWDGDTDANWITPANWSGTAVPGINPTGNATNTTDVATFNAAINGTTLAGSATNPSIPDGTVGNISSNRMVGRLVFDTVDAGAYVIGAAGSTTTLQVGNNLTNVDVTAAVVNPQLINSPLGLHLPSSTNGFGIVQNNATSTSATLTLGGGILNSPNSTRGSQWTLRGSNTGENTISGNLTLTNTGGQTSTVTKAEAGTWVLSGNNTFPAGGGVIVSAGVLAVASNTALGQNATANAQAMAINGGILEIRNGLVINNGVSLNLNNGGTIRAVGTTATDGRVNVGTAAAGSVTIATVNAADVFSIGNGTNDLNGGAADTVLHISGPGTVVQNVASAYAGTWSVDSGTLNLGSPTALGSLGSVNVASGAKLQTMGNNATVTVLTGAGTLMNGSATAAGLTANIAGTNTFAGSLQNGAAGTLDLTKGGAGVLNLSGASTFTGLTFISSGTLNLTGSLGSTAVSGGSGATLSGTGSIAGGVTLDSGVRIAPGDGGDAAIGTLSTGTLALNPGSELNFGITDTSTLDKINVTTSGGLNVSGGQVNINGGSSPFTANGVYNLIGYSGAISGLGVSSLSVNGLNKSVTKNYTFGANGGFVTLTVANSGAVQTFWNLNADGNWGTGANWNTAAVPNTTGAFAGFGGGGTEITADRTITVNGSFTVGTLAFNGAANGKSYTLAAGGGANLTLNNNLSGAFITDTSGSHTIQSPITLTGNGATITVTNAADTLTISGVISGLGNPLVKGGAGTLVLSGSNTHLNGTTINGGTVVINSDSSLGDLANTTTVNAGTLRSTADITSTGFFSVGDVASTFSVAPGTTHTVSGSISDAASVGSLVKTDAGTLVLSGPNSYSGSTVVHAGTVQVNSPNSLGAPTAPLTLNDAVLQATASFTGTRNVSLGSASSRITVDAGQTYTVNGPVSGSGTLNKLGDGTLSLGSNTNNWTGGTVLNAGTLALNLNSFLGPGTVLFEGGTLQNNYGNNNTYGLGNPLSIPTGQTGTINMGNRMSLGAGAVVTGGGTLNVNAGTTVTRDDFSNSWTGFTGQLNIAGSGTIRLLNNGGTFDVNSFTSCAVDIGGTAFLQPATNSNGNTYPIGALSGASATAGIAGATAGRATLSIGGLNTNTSFAGQINGNNNVTKVGSGTLTLSGTYSYTGNTTVSAGTLSLSTGTLSDTGTVSIATGAVLNLNFVGTDTVDVFSIDGVPQGDGTFGAIGSGAQVETALITGTGLLKVTSDPFPEWIAGFSVGALTAKTDDPDGDGLSNLEEFALDGNPASGAVTGKVRAQIETVGTDQVLVITLPVRLGATFAGATSKAATTDDVVYTISGSNNLSAFDQVVTEIAVSAAGMPALSTGWSYRTFRLPGAIPARGPAGFLRATTTDAP